MIVCSGESLIGKTAVTRGKSFVERFASRAGGFLSKNTFECKALATAFGRRFLRLGVKKKIESHKAEYSASLSECFKTRVFYWLSAHEFQPKSHLRIQSICHFWMPMTLWHLRNSFFSALVPNRFERRN